MDKCEDCGCEVTEDDALLDICDACNERRWHLHYEHEDGDE